MVDVDRLKKLSEEYQRLQSNLDSHVEATAQLAAQATENSVVLEELENIEEDAVVYKSVGPVLKRDDRTSAVSNVKKRLEYIKEEQARVDKLTNETKEKIDKLAEQIQQLHKQATAVAAQKQQNVS